MAAWQLVMPFPGRRTAFRCRPCPAGHERPLCDRLIEVMKVVRGLRFNRDISDVFPHHNSVLCIYTVSSNPDSVAPASHIFMCCATFFCV